MALSLAGNRLVSSLPTMPLMMRASVISSTPLYKVSMVSPSRIMVIASQTFVTSLSLWEIRMDVMPCSLNSCIRFSRVSLSSSLSAAVGSSRIRSFTFFDMALQISTSCCLPTPMFCIRVSGLS